MAAVRETALGADAHQLTRPVNRVFQGFVFVVVCRLNEELWTPNKHAYV